MRRRAGAPPPPPVCLLFNYLSSGFHRGELDDPRRRARGPPLRPPDADAGEDRRDAAEDERELDAGHEASLAVEEERLLVQQHWSSMP